MATKKKVPKLAWAVLSVVLGIASIWGVTHYINDDTTTAAVGKVSTYVIVGILLFVLLWFLRGAIKRKKK